MYVGYWRISFEHPNILLPPAAARPPSSTPPHQHDIAAHHYYECFSDHICRRHHLIIRRHVHIKTNCSCINLSAVYFLLISDYFFSFLHRRPPSSLSLFSFPFFYNWLLVCVFVCFAIYFLLLFSPHRNCLTITIIFLLISMIANQNIWFLLPTTITNWCLMMFGGLIENIVTLTATNAM